MKIKTPKGDVGIIVARFQVPYLTPAHIDLIDTVRANHPKVIIFLGLAPIVGGRNNSLDFEARKQMVLEMYPDVTVLYIKDMRDDELWSKRLDEMVNDNLSPGQKPILYGGRDSFIDRYHGKYTTAELEPTMYLSGTELRKEISSKVKASADFRSGVVWLSMNRWPAVVLTVDVVIYDERSRVLLGRKPGENKYRYIGGHAEPKSAHFVDDAKREVNEEAGIESGDYQLIGDALIPDWRYVGEEDKIHTLFYKAKYVYGAPRPADGELAELRWFDKGELTETDIVPEHRVLYHMMLDAGL